MMDLTTEEIINCVGNYLDEKLVGLSQL